MQFFKSEAGIQTIIAVVAAFLFVPFLGQVHLFDWDEINFAESAREMIVSGNYLTVQVNFEPFWEKPPLFIWMQVLSMKLFGINEFAARFPNAICGIVTLIVIYNIGKSIYDRRFGLLWVMLYAGSFLPFFYFKSGIIDPWFNLFIFIGIYFIFRYFQRPSVKFSVLSAIAIGLAVLTKGPVGFLIFSLTTGIYILIKRFRINWIWKHVLLFFLIFALVGGFWFLLQIFNGNYDILVDFIEYQIHLFSKEGAGHGGFLLYHFVILLVGVFPASIFALKGFSIKYEVTLAQQMRMVMVILFSTVLILFTIVNTKIIHYSSMCYFPLTYLATYVVYNIIRREIKPSKWLMIAIAVPGLFYFLLISAIPWIGRNTQKIASSNIIKDEFARGNLQANVHWSGWESLVAVVLLIGIICFVIWWRRVYYLKSFVALFGGAILFLFGAMTIITPKIEGYTQRAAIAFYESKANDNCYIEPLGFKSYAHYFYGERDPSDANVNEHWLLHGDIKKRAWFVIKVHKAEYYFQKYPELIKDYQKNGFVFTYREPK